MKILILFLFNLVALLAMAQPKISFFTEKTSQGIIFYANNNEYCPVSTQMSFSLSNLKPTTGKQSVFVIPAQAKKFVLTTLNKINTKTCDFKFNYKFKSNFGVITSTSYDSLYEYDLPFTKGKSVVLDQGYSGSYSHQNENALDFNMPIGSEVCAARDGVVVEVVQHNSKSCPSRACIDFANYITVYHSDGSFAKYSHLQQNGAKVNVGDTITQGQVIALSGNTGFTNGAHLHFVCYLQGIDKQQTLETYFKINDGSDVYTLVEKETYLKNY